MTNALRPNRWRLTARGEQVAEGGKGATMIDDTADRLMHFAHEVAVMRRRQKLFNQHLGDHGDTYDELLKEAMDSECLVDVMVKQILEPPPLSDVRSAAERRELTIAKRRAYQRGYVAGSRRAWPDYRPPRPPDEIVGQIVEAAQRLRSGVDGVLCHLDEDDEWTQQLGPLVDDLDSAMSVMSEWLKTQVAEETP